MSFDISKYREMFVEEAEELFESADNILLAAENNGSLTEEEMGQLFRDVHTLKGSGASVELTLFAKYTHSVENLMDKLRNHKIEFIPEMAGSLMDALDVMKELLELECDDELTDEIFASKTTETLAIINAYSDAKKEETKAPEVKAAAVAKKKDNITEAVGFYDDDLNSALTNKAYGIFADDDISNDTSADAFGFFDDELEKYQFIIDLGKNLSAFKDEDKITQHIVHGCTSQVWLTCTQKQGVLLFNGTSDAIIVKGLVYILLRSHIEANSEREKSHDPVVSLTKQS